MTLWMHTNYNYQVVSGDGKDYNALIRLGYLGLNKQSELL